jgi:hypothetical protein
VWASAVHCVVQELKIQIVIHKMQGWTRQDSVVINVTPTSFIENEAESGVPDLICWSLKISSWEKKSQSLKTTVFYT